MENRTTKPKRFRAFSGAAGVGFKRPVVIWSVVGRNTTAVDTFVQLYDQTSEASGLTLSVLGENAGDSGQVLAGQPFAFKYDRGWVCTDGFTWACSSSETSLALDATASVWLRVEYSYADEDPEAAELVRRAKGV